MEVYRVTVEVVDDETERLSDGLEASTCDGAELVVHSIGILSGGR